MSDQHSSGPAQYASLDWREDGQPVSSAFDDIYFSSASGLEETRYVFLGQNDLPARWATLARGDTFTIGETGFGTGLNFLATWHLWRQHAPAGARLHFVSVEKFPLRTEDLRRALDLWPELQTLSAQLIAHYPAFLAPGAHRLVFDDGVSLTLVIDEASAGFESLLLDAPERDQLVNAWFLDGFAPAKNPEMWSDALFQAIARLSAASATFATFTCAGIVKRGLKAAGFELHKVPGFGRKREMLRGSLATGELATGELATDEGEHRHRTTPWHLPDAATTRHRINGQRTQIAVIGAGIAGACVARALAERNFQVRVFEQGPAPGSGASGNDQGILYAKLSPKPGPNGDFNLQALQFAQRFYPQVCPQAIHFDGLLQLAQGEREQQLQQQIVEQLALDQHSPLARPVTAQQASELAGVKLASPGLLFPAAGWLQPAQVCAQLLQHPNIELICDTTVTALTHRDPHWQIASQEQQWQADTVVVCCANFNRQFPATAPLPLQPIRGQVSFAAATDASRALKLALCGEGYIAPAHGPAGSEYHSFGATFKLKQTNTEVRAEEHRENLDTLASLVPAVAGSFTSEALRGRVALRAATPDYLPMAGPVAEWDHLETCYGALRKNRKQLINRRCRYQPNLYVLAGLGSRGFTYAPLAAEVVAAWISGEVMPVAADLVKALHPMRFAIRTLGKDRPLQT